MTFSKSIKGGTIILLVTLTSCVLSPLPTTSSSVSSGGSNSVSTSSSTTVSTSVDNSTNSTASMVNSTSSSSGPLTAQQKVELDIANFTYTFGQTLPTLGMNGSTFRWTSEQPGIITNKGSIIALPYGQAAQTVTLTAEVTNGTAYETMTFDVVVPVTPEMQITNSRLVDFVNTSEEYLTTDQTGVSLYFANNGAVPYIDVAQYLSLMNGAIDQSLLDVTYNNDQLTLAYVITETASDGSTLTYNYEGIFDFSLNTFTVNNFDFFSYYVMETETDFGEGLTYVDTVYVDGQPVTIPLGDYRVDLLKYGTNYLVPLQVLDLLLANSLYYDIYYNGDKLYGVDTYTFLDSSSPDISTVRNSSLNSAKMPQDVREASFHFLALAFDYFYGLKNDHQVTTYYTFLNSFYHTFINGTDKSVYETIFNFAYSHDDLHTWHELTGYYELPTYNLSLSSLSQLGPRSQAYYQSSWDIDDQFYEKYGSNYPDSRIIGSGNDTAIIYLYEFTVDTPGQVKTILDGLPSSIKNVVIDLTLNGGGNVGAVLRLFGYMTEEPIVYSAYNPMDGSAVTSYLESDYVAYPFHWFIRTSPVTFSAANLMASMAKEMGVATLLGTKSSGGAASIAPFITPDGSVLFHSSLSILARTALDVSQETRYYSIENGVEVDIPLSDVVNDTPLLNAIASVPVK